MAAVSSTTWKVPIVPIVAKTLGLAGTPNLEMITVAFVFKCLLRNTVNANNNGRILTPGSM